MLNEHHTMCLEFGNRITSMVYSPKVTVKRIVFLTTGSLTQELESWGAFAGLLSTSKTPLILSLWVPVCVGPRVITPPSSQWETLFIVISLAACQGLTVFCRIFGSVRLTEGVCNP